MYQKQIKYFNQFSLSTERLWFQKVIKFILTQTDIEIELTDDRSKTRGYLTPFCKFKNGKLFVFNQSHLINNGTNYQSRFLPFALLHECGHLATIPKAVRGCLKSDLKPKKEYTYNSHPELWNSYMSESWGDELLAQYWSRCVARLLDIPEYPLNFGLDEPYESEEIFDKEFGVRRFYLAKKHNYSTEMWKLNKIYYDLSTI